MNNDTARLLHLYPALPAFSPNEEFKKSFSITSLPFDDKPSFPEAFAALVIETEDFDQIHYDYTKALFDVGIHFVLVIITPNTRNDYLRLASLMTQCVVFDSISGSFSSDTLCSLILPMLRKHIDTLRYAEALKLRSHRSGMVDSLNVVAHQWRQPINLISMEAINLSIQSTLEECVPSESIQKSTQLIADQSQRMAEILKNVLNMGKTHRGKEPFSINEMLERVQLFFADTLQRERIDLQILKLEEDKFLYGYSSDFEEVLVNLISNAKDAFKTMSIEYPKSISIETSLDDAEYSFRVIDNAGGVPEAIREKIFEPHFSTKGQGEGFGIGLHIARLIITQEFKGSLTLSVDGNKTLFTINVPRSDSSQLKFIYS